MEFRFDPSARRFLVRTLVPEGQAARAFAPDDMFQFGIEEEYFLSDAHTLLVPPETPDALFRRANFGGAGSIGREFLQAQIEVATEPHIRAGDARRELLRLRQNASGGPTQDRLRSRLIRPRNRTNNQDRRSRLRRPLAVRRIHLQASYSERAIGVAVSRDNAVAIVRRWLLLRRLTPGDNLV